MNLKNIKEELNKIKRTQFGISIPELRKFAKQIANSNYLFFIKSNDFSTFELKLLHSFVLGYIKTDVKTLLVYLKDFIPYVDNWAICDSLCQNFKLARIYQKEVWDFLMLYKHSSKEFETRLISVFLLSHYLNDNYIDDVIDVLNTLNTEKYYSKMGVAWTFATIMGKYPKKCLNYLQSNKCNLDNITFNKTLQKIRESYKVDKNIKELIKIMKK